MLTRYQRLLVRVIEADCNLPFEKAIAWLRKRNRYSDIAETYGCCRNTLHEICRAYGYDDSHTKVIVDRPLRFMNATEFFLQFNTAEDAIVECRDPDRLGLSVVDTAKKMGVSVQTVTKYTPEYLKYTYNFSKEGLERIREASSSNSPPYDHPWRGNAGV